MSATTVLPAAPRRLTLSIVRYCASCGTRVLRLEPGAAPDAGVEFRNRVFCGGCWRVTARMPRIRAANPPEDMSPRRETPPRGVPTAGTSM